jgi:hypothetical protein
MVDRLFMPFINPTHLVVFTIKNIVNMKRTWNLLIDVHLVRVIWRQLECAEKCSKEKWLGFVVLEAYVRAFNPIYGCHSDAHYACSHQPFITLFN